jgi:hypothetical protein
MRELRDELHADFIRASHRGVVKESPSRHAANFRR